jgi:hypothetical protein
MRATLRRFACSPSGKSKLTSVAGPVQYADPRYPITQTLTDVFGGYRSKDAERRMKQQKTHDNTPGRRVEVVSEQLCGNSNLCVPKSLA